MIMVPGYEMLWVPHAQVSFHPWDPIQTVFIKSGNEEVKLGGPKVKK